MPRCLGNDTYKFKYNIKTSIFPPIAVWLYCLLNLDLIMCVLSSVVCSVIVHCCGSLQKTTFNVSNYL